MKLGKSLKDEYTQNMADHISVSVEDLSENETKLINETFTLFQAKLDDIKAIEDDVKRLNITLANERAMNDNRGEFGSNCPSCGNNMRID